MSAEVSPVLLSLGANLGERLHTLQRAVQMIEEQALLPNVQVSSVYETEPVGYKDQPAFLNLCISGITSLSPLDLRRALSSIETALGRTPRARWHEREIDIDLLLFGDVILESDELTLPHPRMHERNFVLIPAAQIAPEMMHPLLQRSIKQCLLHSGDSALVSLFSE